MKNSYSNITYFNKKTLRKPLILIKQCREATHRTSTDLENTYSKYQLKDL